MLSNVQTKNNDTGNCIHFKTVQYKYSVCILSSMAKLGKKSYCCEKCEHEWTSRYNREPVQCPACKTARWNEKRNKTE